MKGISSSCRDTRAYSEALGLGVWDVGTQAWVVPPGAYRVQVGRSGADVVLADTVTVRIPARAPGKQ
jgi:hypothetical protein